MDTDSKVTLPKYQQGYKDPAARKAYMRKYQLDRYHKLKGIKSADKTLKESEQIVEEKMPVQQDIKPVQINTDSPLLQLAEALKSELEPNDPWRKRIDVAAKWAPLVLQGIQGFTDAMNAAQAQQGQQKKEYSGPQPPPGWIGSTEIQRLSKKYAPNGDLSEWYLQGLAYERAAAGQEIDQAVVTYRPARMEHTVHGQVEAAKQRATSQIAAREQERYRNMQDIERESNTGWDKKQEQQQQPPQEDVKEESPIANDPNAAKQQLNELMSALTEDNKRYLGLIQGYFKSRSIPDFEKDLDNIEVIVQKYKPMLDLLPVQARELFKRMSAEDFTQMIAEQDPEKIKLIKAKKLTPKLKKMLEEIKSIL